MAGIRLVNVNKTFPGNVTVIPGLDLEIKDKEFVILVGPSGCGKSTTLRMIAGLESISSGDLYIGDKRVNDTAPKDRDIAMVFQSYALYPHMSVYNNLAFGLKLRGVPKDEIDKKVKEAAKMLDIEKYLERKPRALSGGQRQRVALGRAMVRSPQVFLLDEPLSNLDAKLRGEMRTSISRLHKSLGVTFVYVTHDQVEAMTMADRIVVMKDGVIQQYDTPKNLYHSPINTFVAGFIGSPRMNLFPAHVSKVKNKIMLKADAYSFDAPASLSALLDGYIDRDVTLGVRPEDIHAEEFYMGLDNTLKINVTVDMAEMMGAELYAYFELAGERMISRIPSRMSVSEKDTLPLAIDLNKIHIFDKETGKSIRV
ncbi:MAG: sn-glycerol-3-phosphate ABC transporter ATP-binding protein UgpC [Clostridia bacterium]|nr:sn-glycerol-3-phosphate ABC transporter ATP-binding protein UgpC [Clostridia bacterium]